MTRTNTPTCEHCGSVHDGTFATGRFCRVQCSRAYATAKRRSEINAKVSKTNKAKHARHIQCAGCGVTFRAPRKRSKFCSRACTPQRNKGSEAYAAMGRAGASALGKRSKGEILFYDLCADRGWSLTHNDPAFEGYDADILIHDHKIAIHYDGPCHRRVIFRGQSLAQIQTRDRRKRAIIERHGWRNFTIEAERTNVDFLRLEFKRLIAFIERTKTDDR